ncbi:MAG: hypothetical protein U0R78_09720 [Nocardioidaceae bacterium]
MSAIQPDTARPPELARPHAIALDRAAISEVSCAPEVPRRRKSRWQGVGGLVHGMTGAMNDRHPLTAMRERRQRRRRRQRSSRIAVMAIAMSSMKKNPVERADQFPGCQTDRAERTSGNAV